jgi:hypothetical protein
MSLTGATATAYPKATGYVCPYCGAPIVLDQYACVTHADHDGCPVEETGNGFYCTNKLCEHHGEAIEEDWLGIDCTPPQK